MARCGLRRCRALYAGLRNLVPLKLIRQARELFLRLKHLVGIAPISGVLVCRASSRQLHVQAIAVLSDVAPVEKLQAILHLPILVEKLLVEANGLFLVPLLVPHPLRELLDALLDVLAVVTQLVVLGLLSRGFLFSTCGVFDGLNFRPRKFDLDFVLRVVRHV